MANLARLTVSIVGNTVSLNKSLDKAETRTKKFQRNASKSLSVLKGGLIALGVGIAAFSVKAIQDYASVGDEIDKMSKRTGFSAESLSKLRFAAEQSGAELATVEKGAKRMAAVLLDAELGLKTSTDSLELLNLNLTDFEGLNPDEKFFKFAKAISTVEDPTRRAALAQKIFGRAGTELLPLFQEGEKGLAALSEQAQKLGIVYSQKAAKDAAAFKDAQNALGKALQGFLAKGIAPLLPKLTDMINTIVENEDVLNLMGKTIIFVADAVIRFFDEVQVAIKGIQDFIQVIKGFVEEVDKQMDIIPGLFTGAFENAYLGSIPWIAKGKLLRHIQTLPFSVKSALQPIPDVFDTAFSQAFILVAEDFNNLETRIIGGSQRIVDAIEPVEMVIERVATATELATVAFVANNRQWAFMAGGAAKAANNIRLATAATNAQTKAIKAQAAAHAAAFKATEIKARATLRSNNGGSMMGGVNPFGSSGNNGLSGAPTPPTPPEITRRRFGSERGDESQIFAQLEQLLAGTLTASEANAQNRVIVEIDGRAVAAQISPHLNQEILDDRQFISE